ncbi:conserved hypothetical protein [Pediculus humanus corporis]|uniref:Uncharacterized protein n=1 Tax=Pediculus humanus subsp. corporis TaxID=121224 RepID=E0VTR2_PEDHC|nr:uncharacterized protein Phum_PHUM436570 [Pediculus humanus corporis]EEB16768.1 conserved hypothetical protein [Pediculus humanus corporis]
MMNKISKEIYKTDKFNIYSSHDYDDCGVILGYWDQEKTPEIVQDLENSIRSVEKKCKKLFLELIYYQYYHQDCNNNNNSNPSTPNSSLMVNELKNYKLETSSVPELTKLWKINKKLKGLSSKIGIDDKIILFHTNEYVRKLREKAIGNIEKYLPKLKKTFLKTYAKHKVIQSDTVLTTPEENVEYSKISKSEYNFYKSASKKKFKPLKKNLRKKGIMSPERNTNQCKRKNYPSKNKSNKRIWCADGKDEKKNKTSSHSFCKNEILNNHANKSKNDHSMNKLNSNFIVTTYPWSPKESIGSIIEYGVDKNLDDVKNDDKINCCLTSKEYKTNDDLIQKKLIDDEKNIWMPTKVNLTPDKRCRSKYTKTISDKSKTATTIMISQSRKNNYFEIPNINLLAEASGDNSKSTEDKKVRTKWEKLVNEYSELYSYYSGLKESAINDKTISPTKLKQIVKEIDEVIENYQNFLRVYYRFLQLKSKVKSLKPVGQHTSIFEKSHFICSSSIRKNYNEKKKENNSVVLKETFNQVLSVGPTELSHTESDSAMLLNCWEKTSPLIKGILLAHKKIFLFKCAYIDIFILELERTVNFAERKCGDLMQKLNYYKEYYEKWVNAERLGKNMHLRKKNKKYCRHENEDESSSENEFEKVNRYFYKKIRSKINEMNHEITIANRKLQNHNNKDDETAENESKIKMALTPKKENKGEQVVNGENKTCESESFVSVKKQESLPSETVIKDCLDDFKLSERQSTKSVPVENLRSRKKELNPQMKRGFSTLQRYKLRSKSLPQGVRRKFGFGGFIEVFDSKVGRLSNNPSKSKTSLKANSIRSFKTFKSEGQGRLDFMDHKNTLLRRKTISKSARSLQQRMSKSKIDFKSNGVRRENFFSKNIKSEPNFSENFRMTIKNSNVNNLNNKPSINSCKAIVPSENIMKNSFQPKMNSHLGNISNLISKPNTLIPFLKQPIPFIPCSSTTKTFNLGLNVQQVLSLIKNKKHSISLETLVRNGMKATRSISNKIEPTVNTLFFSHSQVTSSSVCPAQTCIEDSFSVVTSDVGYHSNCSLLKRTQALRSETDDNKKINYHHERSETKINEEIEINKIERPEDVWVVEQPDGYCNLKKTRSKCTCYPSKNCVDYQKVLREYTTWASPDTKSTTSFTSDCFSSYNSTITYRKPKLCTIPSGEKIGLGMQENGKIEINKIQKGLITQKNLDVCEASAEIDSIESELSLKEMEFKNILNFYQELLLLKDKIKTLRNKNINSSSQSTIQQQGRNQKIKKDPLRPTPSMALANVLRKIQGLQDKIKLIDKP